MTAVPPSHLVTRAQAERARRRRGLARAKVLIAVFACAAVVGMICGIVAPGA